MLLVGADGPFVEVVDLLVDVVGDLTLGIPAALGLENADGCALAFDGAALGVDGFKVLVKEGDGGGVFGVVGGFCLGGFDGPVGDVLAFLGGGGDGTESQQSRKGRCDAEGGKWERRRHD